MELGTKGYAETTVDESNIASNLGSGTVRVFSTPSMILLMEKAACLSVRPFLEEGTETVGIDLNVAHLASTPQGQKVWAESELIEAEGRVLTFKVTAWSEKEKIGEGTHKRCIINCERFMDKMNKRYE